jgi:hypothetical protein
MSGCVTVWSAIAGKSPEMIERVLGYNHFTLRGGFRVYRLAEMVAPNDFEWLDTTRHSAGWHYDPEINEYVQRQDEQRWDLFAQSNYDTDHGDRAFNGFMGQEQQKLNVRTGWAQIVKVVPKGRATGFPDSEIPHIPQWRISARRPKSFVLLCDVPARAPCPSTLPGG